MNGKLKESLELAEIAMTVKGDQRTKWAFEFIRDELTKKYTGFKMADDEMEGTNVSIPKKEEHEPRGISQNSPCDKAA